MIVRLKDKCLHFTNKLSLPTQKQVRSIFRFRRPPTTGKYTALKHPH